jgi:hypothetical protein
VYILVNILQHNFRLEKFLNLKFSLIYNKLRVKDNKNYILLFNKYPNEFLRRNTRKKSKKSKFKKVINSRIRKEIKR